MTGNKQCGRRPGLLPPALLAAALLASAATLSAGTVSLSFFQGMTDNLFQNRDASPDDISTLQLAAEKGFGSFSIFGDGGLALLRRNPGLGFFQAQAGADYLQPLNEKTALYVSAVFGGTVFRPEFNDYGHSSLKFLAAVKSYLSPESIVRSQYAFERRSYNLPVYDFSSHSLLVSADRYFPSRTTLKAEAGWGYKIFLNPYPAEDDVVVSGRGPRGGMYRQAASGSSQGLQVLALEAVAAQGLGDRLGLRLSARRQWTLSGRIPFTEVEDYYQVENPTYDGFSWNGLVLGGQATVELPWDIQARMSYTYSRKAFPGVESLDLEGAGLGVEREDTRRTVEARLEKNFRSFSLFLSFASARNSSNDPFFEWRGTTLSGGVQWHILRTSER